MSRFYMLAEDRIREDQQNLAELYAAQDARAQRRKVAEGVHLLVKRMREAIEGKTPGRMTSRALLQKEFALIDKDRTGAVDFKEFRDMAKKYLAGAEMEEIRSVFQLFDKDKNGTISVREFVDTMLAEAGPHNFQAKKPYNRNKVQKPPLIPPSV